MVASPVATLTTIGKNEIRKAVSTAGTIRDRVEADHHGIKAAVDRARPADDDAEHDAESDGEGEAGERRPQGDEGVLGERQPILADRLKYLRGCGQHEGIDFEDAADELPQHKHADGKQPGR
jgi:hypothetical protein